MSLKKPLGISLLVGLLALAFAALPALASAATVTLHAGSKTGAALANGTAIKGFSSTLKFATAGGNLECKENQLNGTVENNGTEKTSLKITSATFHASGGGADCLTTISNGSGGTLTATITAANLPRTLDLLSSGAASLTGTPTVKFTAVLDNGTTPVATCVYERTSVATTFNFTTALVATVGASQVFKLASGTSLCPIEGTLSGPFSVTTSTGGTIVATTP